MSNTTIQNALNSIFIQQETDQFGTNRYAILFKPGTYSAGINVGFYTWVMGPVKSSTQTAYLVSYP